MKIKRDILVIAAITFFAISGVIFNNLDYNLINSEEKTQNNNINTPKNRVVENLKTSKSWKRSTPILIDEINGPDWDTINSTYSWCNGKGTKTDPYIIENITIDCGGVGSYGICVNYSQDICFIIRNCTVYNTGNIGSYSAGIELFVSRNGTLINNNCSNNNYYGIILLACNNISVIENTIDSNKNVGLVNSGGANNIFLGNNVTNNNVTGILFWGSINNQISGNIVTNNSWGICIGEHSDNNIISGNNASRNNIYGISLQDSNNNTVLGNNATSNGYEGIFLKESANNTIVGNTINNNDDDGISLRRSANNTILGNTVNDNIGDGINIYKCNITTISENTVKNNDDEGISLYMCNISTISGNTVKNNDDDGINIYNCNISTISGNTVENNDQNGISIYDSDNITIFGNKIYFNDDTGIQVVFSNNSNFLGNEISNSNEGMWLYNSNFNNITNNIITNNTYGILLQSSNYNNLSGNILVNNVYNIVEISECKGNTIENNDYYTKILPLGINKFEIEPYNLGNTDINITIALNDETQVFFSAFSVDIGGESLDNGFIFINLHLNDTDNLDQNFKAPINITIKYDISKYENIKVFWFNDSANEWEEIPFTDLGNGLIIVSINHTSIFALTGKEKANPLPLTSDDKNGDKTIKSDVNITIFLVLLAILGSVGIVSGFSIYQHKKRKAVKPRTKKTKTPFVKKKVASDAKDYVKNSKLLEILGDKNALEKPVLFENLNITAISPEFWEKINIFDLDKKDRVEFIKNMLSFTSEERKEIIDGMLKLRESDLENANKKKHY